MLLHDTWKSTGKTALASFVPFPGDRDPALGRSPDLLRINAFPFLKQWPEVNACVKLTVAGTVAVFHRVPFSSRSAGTKSKAKIAFFS